MIIQIREILSDFSFYARPESSYQRDVATSKARREYDNGQAYGLGMTSTTCRLRQ